MTETKDNRTDIEKATGETEVEVFYVGKEEPETVKVREINARNLQKLVDLSTNLNEAELVELYTGKPKGWDDKLRADSHAKIIEEGERMNFPILATWLKRQTTSMSRIAGVLQDFNAGAKALSSSLQNSKS